MKLTTYLVSLLVAVGTGIYSFLGGATPYNIGDTVSDFQLKSTDSKVVSMAAYRPDAKGYILAFTCNHCPFSRAYEDRIIALDRQYAPKGYPVIAINPNDPSAYEEDSMDNMRARAKEKNYSFPYLADESQEVTRAFGATRTPSIYVVKKEGDKFVLQYMGTIDDNSQDPAGVTKKYVEDAINNLLVGKPVMMTTTKSVGCAIKWKS
ncbi:MAG: thioredoxin family protein [Spirosomataceae bacterium]